jgi:two-component system, LuxR family, sensor kinase FixL
MLRQGYRLQIGGQSLIGQCVAQGEANIAWGLARRNKSGQDSFLPNTASEVAIPLILRHKVIGAISAHSEGVAAFSEQDLTILRILADQLANAIENARLFAELRHSEEKYRTIIENIEEGYYETDLDGRFTFVNDSLCVILSIAKEEILGRPYLSFALPQSSDVITSAFKAVWQSGQTANTVEFQIFDTNQEDRFVETSVALMRESSNAPLGFRGVIRDTTHRKEAEQLLIERKALERSNRELEQFAYVASHDLQEPLRKIRTFGDRLKTNQGPNLDEEGRDFVDRMLNATGRMQSLIDDLLALSRVATKAKPFVPVDLGQVAHEVLFDLEARIEQSGAKVEVGKLASLEADPAQMRQLMQNLIGNALKFHRPGVPPSIKVYGRLSTERRPTGRLGNEYQMVVEDNGIGFDEKYAERIFQPFQRLHGRNVYEGTGIGLAICHRIAERHAGRITVKSTPGQGTT